MVDVTCIVIPLTLVPIIITIAAAIVFLKYPDKHSSIILLSVGLMLLIALVDLLTDQFFVLKRDTMSFLFSSIVQGYSAMIGILGAFLIFYIEGIKNKIVGIRKEVIRRVPEPDFSKTFSNDEEFIDYLRGWSEGHKKLESPYRTVQYSIVMLTSLVREEQKMKMIISNLFLFLFTSIFIAMVMLLIQDSFSAEDWVFKILVYFLFSFSLTALMSAIYGVYRIIYPDNAV